MFLDSKTSRIWKIKNDIPSVYLENVKGANGLKAVRNDLIYAQGESLMKADANKKLTKIAELPESIDGIEPVGERRLYRYWLGGLYLLCTSQWKYSQFTGYPSGKNKHGGPRI